MDTTNNYCSLLLDNTYWNTLYTNGEFSKAKISYYTVMVMKQNILFITERVIQYHERNKIIIESLYYDIQRKSSSGWGITGNSTVERYFTCWHSGGSATHSSNCIYDEGWMLISQ